ncbi:MAG TPA: hypothetical protein DGG94_17380 [Micromonosporaceae bacterium]|nr:hypothetical protein [Micromonosporaceae bacterium]HCU51544.1 hypothetical protein [Micromonosporaceae bacterium]
MSELRVWLHDQHIASLRTDRRSRLELAYLPDVVSRYGEGTTLLSVALPVSSVPHRTDVVEAWVDGLLPEGEMRTVLERMFAVRRGDSFSLLSALGRDCAGAVVFTPPEQPPQARGRAVPLTDSEVASALDALPQHPLGVDIDVRVSLGGLQSKLLLVRTKKGWARPEGGAPSTHILKPEPPEFPGLVAAEAFAQKAAAIAGLEAASVEIAEFGNRTVLVVERFDRELHDGNLVRIHQEDACQALGLNPDRKYQTLNGTGSYQAIANVLRMHGERPERELQRLGRMMAFTTAIGNTDAHLRNHALLHRSGAVVLAPVYDCAPTIDFAATRQVALWVAGQPMLSAITGDHLVREMSGWGIETSVALATIRSTLEAAGDALPAAADSVGKLPKQTVSRALRRVRSLLATIG